MKEFDAFLNEIDSNCEVLSKSLEDSPLSLIQFLSEQRGRIIEYRLNMDKSLPPVNRMYDLEAKIEKTISILSIDLRENLAKI